MCLIGRSEGEEAYLRDEVLEVLDAACSDSLLSFCGKLSVVEVKELLGAEGKESLEDTVTDTSGTDSSNNLALKVECITGNL